MAGMKKPGDPRALLLDAAAPLEMRRAILGRICGDESPKAAEIVGWILQAAASANGEELWTKKSEELSRLIAELSSGPLREATFLRMIDGAFAGKKRACVVFDDGTVAFVLVPDDDLARALRCGESVLVDGQARSVLQRMQGTPAAGEEARLERVLDGERVEVQVGEIGRHVFRVSAKLDEAIRAERVSSGDSLIVCPRRRMAFDAVPRADGLGHLRFLARERVPDVVVARDLGAPPAYIEEIARLAKLEMTDPGARRRYRLRKCATRLLAGVSGSGKTFSILALWRRLYEVMSEVTGTPIEELPPRVFRLRPSQILSKWLGESDKNLDRFFDEIEELADEPFVGRDGRSTFLPTLAILEEVDGLAKSRGEDQIHDRILTTALQRLDPTRSSVRDRLIFFVATTNVASQVDSAFLRRAGGKVERFGRLDRRGFVSVVKKHVAARPLAAKNGHAPEEIERDLVAHATNFLFSRNGTDKGVVELGLASTAAPLVKHRRDFLTASVVDLSVEEAAEAAWLEEAMGGTRGITREQLLGAFERQIASLVDRLEPANATSYVDVPEGARVVSVRRLARPALPSYLLERSSPHDT